MYLSGRCLRSIQWVLATLGFLIAAPGAGEIYARGGLKLTGDFRARLEADFDSKRSDGTPREDRDRLRIRLRLGLEYAANEHFSLGLRLRSGSDDSHQSPHVTLVDFDDNDTGDADLNLDRWFAQARGERLWGWAGRNSLPLWKQNELLWDDDVTPVGLALGFERQTEGGGRLAVNTGYFSPPVGMRDFAGELALGQLVYSSRRLTVAGALLAYDADRDDADALRLLRRNGLRDYRLWVGSFQTRLEAHGRSLVLGVDLIHNGEDYPASDPDPFTASHRDQTDGFVLSARLGETRAKGDWRAAYTYAEIEALAVIASYSQDDWMRWGSAVENRGSDFRGHELRFDYVLAKDLTLVSRLYLVESITTSEDGSRFRVDLNYRF